MLTATRIAAVALALLASPEHRAAAATILLEVDATDPDAVTFIATDGVALASSSGVSFSVLLKDLLIGRVSVSAPANDLLSAQVGNVVDRFFARGSDLDLNIFGGTEQVFIEGERAFTGSATVALPATSGRGGSFVGDITVRNNFGQDTSLVTG